MTLKMKTEHRADSMDWYLPSIGSGQRCDAADASAAHRITSTAQLRGLLGRRDPLAPAPRHHPAAVRHDAAVPGQVRSSAELRQRLGIPEPRQPRAAPALPSAVPRTRQDAAGTAAGAAGPIRSLAELRAALEKCAR